MGINMLSRRSRSCSTPGCSTRHSRQGLAVTKLVTAIQAQLGLGLRP